MKQWLRRRAAVAVFVFALAAMSAMALTTGSVAVSHAQPWCPVGWYWDNYMRSCQPVRAPSVTACVTASGRRGYVTGGVCVGN
jgi:type IV secretory pathway protease TraF